MIYIPVYQILKGRLMKHLALLPCLTLIACGSSTNDAASRAASVELAATGTNPAYIREAFVTSTDGLNCRVAATTSSKIVKTYANNDRIYFKQSPESTGGFLKLTKVDGAWALTTDNCYVSTNLVSPITSRILLTEEHMKGQIDECMKQLPADSVTIDGRTVQGHNDMTVTGSNFTMFSKYHKVGSCNVRINDEAEETEYFWYEVSSSLPNVMPIKYKNYIPVPVASPAVILPQEDNGLYSCRYAVNDNELASFLQVLYPDTTQIVGGEKLRIKMMYTCTSRGFPTNNLQNSRLDTFGFVNAQLVFHVRGPGDKPKLFVNAVYDELKLPYVDAKYVDGRMPRFPALVPQEFGSVSWYFKNISPD